MKKSGTSEVYVERLCFLADIECNAFGRPSVEIVLVFDTLGDSMAAYLTCSSSSLLFTQWTSSTSEVFSSRASLANAHIHGLHVRSVALPSKLWRRPLEGKERLGNSLSVNASTTSVQGICHG